MDLVFMNLDFVESKMKICMKNSTLYKIMYLSFIGRREMILLFWLGEIKCADYQNSPLGFLETLEPTSHI